MELNASLEYLKQLVTTHPEQIINGLMNGCLGTDKQGKSHMAKLKPTLDILSKYKEFHALFHALADASRRQFSKYGVSLESLLAATYMSGFLAGCQFIMDGGETKSPLPEIGVSAKDLGADSPPDQSPVSSNQLN